MHRAYPLSVTMSERRSPSVPGENVGSDWLAARDAAMAKRALAWAGGLVLLALVVATVPLTRAAHQSSTASDVGVLVAFAVFGSVGVVVAVRQPRNVMG